MGTDPRPTAVPSKIPILEWKSDSSSEIAPVCVSLAPAIPNL